MMFNLEQGKRNVENIPQKVIKSYEQLSCIIRIFICRLPVLGTRQKYLPRYIQSRKFQNREVDMNTNVLPSNISTNQLLSSLSPFPVVMNIKRIYLPLEVKRKHTHTQIYNPIVWIADMDILTQSLGSITRLHDLKFLV